MRAVQVAIAGRIGVLAQKTRDLLENRGFSTIDIPVFKSTSSILEKPDALIYFPFGTSKEKEYSAELNWMSSLLDWVKQVGVKRVVLRSCATAYGNSFKNYGLMEEDRVSLLTSSSVDYRWLNAEGLVLPKENVPLGFSSAALRFANVAHLSEGSYISSLMLKKIAFPLAGYDPRIQFVSVSDAAIALVSAVESQASGIFNISSSDALPFRKCLKTVVNFRIPVGRTLQKPLRKVFSCLGKTSAPVDSIEHIRYNFTVSGERSLQELGFKPMDNSLEAFRGLVPEKKKKQIDKSDLTCDEFGLDSDYLAKRQLWFDFLTKVYWRVEIEGLENIPKKGAGLMVSNHRGFMPFDGVVHRTSIHRATGRQIRFLVIPSLFKFPFLSNFLIKQGGVVASQQNTRRMFDRDELVGIFPEGINGAFRPYRGAYRLGAFARDAFAKLAIEHQVPVIPAVAVGHVEIFPILAKLRIPSLSRWLGWPYIPLTPTFPLLPIPLPTKWHIRYLEPVSVHPLKPEDAANRTAVRSFSKRIREVMQNNIDDMLSRRKHIFYGSIFKSDKNTVKSPSEK